jgi:hypothetical protein
MWSRLVLAVVMTGISASDGLSATEELPKSCSRADVEKYGRPVIFERQRGIAFGVSACELTFLQKIQVFNSSGLPLERAAHKRLRDEGKSDNDLVAAPQSSPLSPAPVRLLIRGPSIARTLLMSCLRATTRYARGNKVALVPIPHHAAQRQRGSTLSSTNSETASLLILDVD